MSTIGLNVEPVGMAVVTVDADEQSLQPFTAPLRAELASTLQKLANDANVKGVLLRLTSTAVAQPSPELLELGERRVTAVAARDRAREWQRTLRHLETCGKPVAAVLTGSIIGGCLDLALACHYRVVLDGAQTTLGYPEVQMGLLPWGGGTQRLPRLIGVKQALPLLLNGYGVDATQALELGVVHAAASSLDESMDLAHTRLLNAPQGVQPWDRKGFRVPGGAGPLAEFANESFMIGAAQLRKQVGETQPAPLAIMSAVYEGTIASFDAGLTIEANYFGKLLSDPVAGSLMRAAHNIAQARLNGSPATTVGDPVKEFSVLAEGTVGPGIGPFTARVLSAFIDEGACMLAEGIVPALIENAAKQAGMPVGPLAQFDEVSQQLSWKIIQQARANGLDTRYTREAAAHVIEKMIALNRRGRHLGGGFYEFPQGGRKFLWPGLREHFPARPEQPTAAELKSRMLAIQALEAARCLEEGVIESARDADVGSMLGIGYPRWTGGVLSYIDVLGPQCFVDQCAGFAMRHGARYEPSAWLRARAAADERFYPRAQAS